MDQLKEENSWKMELTMAELPNEAGWKNDTMLASTILDQWHENTDWNLQLSSATTGESRQELYFSTSELSIRVVSFQLPH